MLDGHSNTLSDVASGSRLDQADRSGCYRVALHFPDRL